MQLEEEETASRIFNPGSRQTWTVSFTAQETPAGTLLTQIFLGPGFGVDGQGKGQNIRRWGVRGSVIVTSHYLSHLTTVRYARHVANTEAIRNWYKFR